MIYTYTIAGANHSASWGYTLGKSLICYRADAERWTIIYTHISENFK